MTLKYLLFAALSAMAVTAHAESKVSYVGSGRYVCSDNSAQCAQIDANNRQQQERSTRDYDRNQDRANSYVDQQRRKDEERRNEYRNR